MDREAQCCIGIRADGNEKLGMGHLMRCRTIAQQLQIQGSQVVFFTASSGAAKLILEWGFEAIALETPYDQMEAELPLMEIKLQEKNICLLVVDSYQVTDKYLKSLGKILPVVILDDMGKNVFPVDGLINYNIYGAALPYSQLYSKDTMLLLGCEYAPVRNAFRQQNFIVQTQVKHLLITMGGSDSYNISGLLAEKLLQETRDIQINVVCGAFNSHFEMLQELAKNNPRLSIHQNVTDMASLMCSCDLAVSAAGSTMYELCAIGLPTITCYYVENQRQIAESFGSLTKVPNAGDFTKNAQKMLEEIVAFVSEYSKSLYLRQELSLSMQQVVDGMGAERIAKELIDLWKKRR